MAEDEFNFSEFDNIIDTDTQGKSTGQKIKIEIGPQRKTELVPALRSSWEAGLKIMDGTETDIRHYEQRLRELGSNSPQPGSQEAKEKERLEKRLAANKIALHKELAQALDTGTALADTITSLTTRLVLRQEILALCNTEATKNNRTIDALKTEQIELLKNEQKQTEQRRIQKNNTPPPLTIEHRSLILRLETISEDLLSEERKQQLLTIMQDLHEIESFNEEFKLAESADELTEKERADHNTELTKRLSNLKSGNFSSILALKKEATRIASDLETIATNKENEINQGIVWHNNKDLQGTLLQELDNFVQAEQSAGASQTNATSSAAPVEIRSDKSSGKIQVLEPDQDLIRAVRHRIDLEGAKGDTVHPGFQSFRDPNSSAEEALAAAEELIAEKSAPIHVGKTGDKQ